VDVHGDEAGVTPGLSMRILALATLAACAGFATAVGTSSGATACGSAPQSGTLTIRAGGRNRTVIVHLPSGFAPGARVPLVLNLHGSGSTALQQREFSGMSKTSNAYGFVVAYPQGAIAQGSGFDWNVPGQPLVGGRRVPAGSPDDVAFLKELIGDLERTDCADPHHIYATGFSGGARMASQLGCDLAGTVAAIAPVSGLRFPSPCHATRAVSVLAFHGREDPVDPYAGHGQPYWTYGVQEAAMRWAAHDGCSASPLESHGSSDELTRWAGCKGGSAVELYTLTEGHEWPGGPLLPPSITRLLGPQTSEVDADAVMWRFFAAHPLR
jgi:polyhydroxybutyrate depolymerase